jgi:hypothetical protein
MQKYVSCHIAVAGDLPRPQSVDQVGRLFLIDLGRQVVSNVAHGADGVLHHDGDIRRQRQRDGGAERGGLGEQGQVAEGEVQVNGLLHVDHDSVVILVHGGVVLKHDVASAEVAGGGEADALLRHANRAYMNTNNRDGSGKLSVPKSANEQGSQ